MKIMLKFLFRNIKENKLRTFLIWFSITLSTALLFSTLSIPGTIEKKILDDFNKYTGTSELFVETNKRSSRDPFFIIQSIPEIENQIEYTIGVVESRGSYIDQDGDPHSVFVGGYTKDELLKLHNIEIKNGNEFSGNRVIIGKGEANAFNLQEGDMVSLYINGNQQEFTIHEIIEPNGLFDYDGLTLSAVLPKDTLASIYDHSGEINKIYIKTTDEDNLKEVYDHVSNAYDDYIVNTAVSKGAVQGSIRSITSTFALMLVLVIFISIFIIYTSFKVISFERLPIIGTFRSIGATRKITDIILLLESILYGIIGGISGCLLGYGILKIMMSMMAYNAYTDTTTHIDLVIGIEQVLIAFLSAVFLSIVSSIIPIIKVSKIPVRDIVLNNIREFTRRSYILEIIGFLLIVIPFITMRLKSDQTSMALGVISMVTIAIGVIILVPYVTRGLGIVFEKVNAYLFSNEGILAAKNLRDNKNITNNITLLTIGISSLLMINTVTTSVANEVVNVFNDAKFEITVNHPKGDEDFIDEIESIPDVDDAYGLYTAPPTKVKEKNTYVNNVWGIDAKTYFNFWDMNIVGNQDDVINKFGKGRHVILTMNLKNKFNVEEGESITLSFYDEEVTYTVYGFVNSNLFNGEFFLIPSQYLREDANVDYMNEIYIKTDDTEAVSRIIKDRYEKDQVSSFTMDAMKQNNMESNNQLFTLLTGFSVITMVIGIFGIFNNYVVSYISRRKSLAMYRSIGMSKKQTLKMLLVESFTGGVIGGITGLVGAYLFIMIAAYILEAMFLPINMNISFLVFAFGFISAILLSLISSLLPAMKSSKREIIEALKYE